MKRFMMCLLVLCCSESLLFADGAEWVSGKIKQINPIGQIIILTPENAISEDSIIEIMVDENTIFTDIDSFNQLKVDQEVEIEIYDDETTPSKIAREIVLLSPPKELESGAAKGVYK